MLAIDKVNRPYQRWLGPLGSYVVELGSHRIAMLDSSWDVGAVSSIGDGLRAFFGVLSEDERAVRLARSPNCEGVWPASWR